MRSSLEATRKEAEKTVEEMTKQFAETPLPNNIKHGYELLFHTIKNNNATLDRPFMHDPYPELQDLPEDPLTILGIFIESAYVTQDPFKKYLTPPQIIDIALSYGLTNGILQKPEDIAAHYDIHPSAIRTSVQTGINTIRRRFFNQAQF